MLSSADLYNSNKKHITIAELEAKLEAIAKEKKELSQDMD